MKILQIDAYHHILGGAEKVMFNTAQLLEEHGHEVVYFSLRWDKNLESKYSRYFPESKETRKGLFRNLRNLINFYYHFEAAKKIEQLIKDERPDIAQIHIFWCQITPSVFPILKKYKIPIVFTVHDFRTVCLNASFRNGQGEICELCKGKYFNNGITKRCVKGSFLLSAITCGEFLFRNTFFHPAKYIDGLIYVSNFAKKKIEEYVPRLRSKKSIVLYNFSVSVDEMPKRSISEKYFLYFGRLSHEKGVWTLIKSFINIPHSKLKIVGTGEMEESLRQLARGYDNIEFLGYKSGEELQQLVANAYFVIVPSECYENNPMTIVEAYSHGTPVIGSTLGGIPEIIEDGKTGFLFTANNEVELYTVVESSLKLDESEYALMRQQSYDFGKKHFNKDNYYIQLLSLFEDLMNKK